MGRKKILKSLNFSTFFELLKLSVVNPHQFIEIILPFPKLKDPLIFFTTNIVLGFLVKNIIDSIKFNNWVLLLHGITEMLFTLPVVFLGLLLFAIFLHLLAKALKGQGNFKSSLKIVCFSSSSLIIFYVPFINILGLILILRVLIPGFLAIHKYSLPRVIINIVGPFLAFLLLIFALGLLKIPIFKG